MILPYRDPPADPRELVGDWVLDGAGRGASKIGEPVRVFVALHQQTHEEIVMLNLGDEVASIPVALLRRILG